MDFSEYQQKALATAAYDDDDQAFNCIFAGMMGELGELAEKWKKYKRNDDVKAGMSEIDAYRKFIAGTISEAGDLLWYLAMYLYLFDIDMDKVALTNLNKLRQRAESGVLHASGDDR